MTQPTLFATNLPTTPTPTAKPGRNAWLDAHIDTITGGDRTCRTHRCPTCKAKILTGLDEDQCAFTVHVDPTPLTPLGEALCLLAGRRTYQLRPHGETLMLTRRTAGLIRHYPAGEYHRLYPGDCVPAHRCSDPVNDQLIAASVLQPKTKPSPNAPCPF